MAKTQQTITWVSLLIAGLALIIATSNYLQANELRGRIQSLEDASVNTTESALMQVRTAVVDAAEETETSIEQEQELLERVEALRTDIAFTYQQVNQKAQSELDSIDSKLEMIEQEAREDAVGAINSLQEMAEEIESRLQTPDSEETNN